MNENKNLTFLICLVLLMTLLVTLHRGWGEGGERRIQSVGGRYPLWGGGCGRVPKEMLVGMQSCPMLGFLQHSDMRHEWQKCDLVLLSAKKTASIFRPDFLQKKAPNCILFVVVETDFVQNQCLDVVFFKKKNPTAFKVDRIDRFFLSS